MAPTSKGFTFKHQKKKKKCDATTKWSYVIKWEKITLA